MLRRIKVVLEKLYGLQDTIERKRKPWTVGALITDFKLAGLTDDGIKAYLFGLEVSNEIKLDRGMTLSQFKNIIMKR